MYLIDLVFFPSFLLTAAFEILVCLFSAGNLLITFAQVFDCRNVDFVLACYINCSASFKLRHFSSKS